MTLYFVFVVVIKSSPDSCLIAKKLYPLGLLMASHRDIFFNTVKINYQGC